MPDSFLTPPTRWTPPTLLAELQRRRVAKGDLAPVENRPMTCGRCHAPGVAADMLADLRALDAATRVALGFDAALDWVCTGCLGTAHNLGRLSHYEQFVLAGAPPEALAWATAHTERFPYPHGTPASADAYALALGRSPPSLPPVPA